MPRIVTRLARLVLLCLLAVYFAHLVHYVSKNSADQQWDFTIYYWADKTVQAGLNPYQVDDLKEASGLALWLPYVYPPVTTWVFRPFTLMPYKAAYYLWLGLKLAALAGLIFLWRRYFLKQIWSLFFLFILIFGFDSALFWDMRSGNIALLEIAVLYFAFVALLSGRYRLFALLIVLVSLFKVTTLFFLLLLLFFPVRHRRRLIWLGTGMFTLIMVINYLFQPELFSAYVDRALSIDERAKDYNYSLIAFLKDLAEIIFSGRFPTLAVHLPRIAYAIAALGIVAASTAAARRIWRRAIPDGAMHTVFLACLCYALVFPRLKCYSLLLLIVPMFYLMRTLSPRNAAPVFVLMLCIPIKSPLPEVEPISRLFPYYPLAVVFVVWYSYLQFLRHADLRMADAEKGDVCPGNDSGSHSDAVI